MNLENDECGEPKEKSCLPRLFLVLVFLIIFISLVRRLVGGALSAGVLFRERKESLLYFFQKERSFVTWWDSSRTGGSRGWVRAAVVESCRDVFLSTRSTGESYKISGHLCWPDSAQTRLHEKSQDELYQGLRIPAHTHTPQYPDAGWGLEPRRQSLVLGSYCWARRPSATAVFFAGKCSDPRSTSISDVAEPSNCNWRSTPASIIQ